MMQVDITDGDWGLSFGKTADYGVRCAESPTLLLKLFTKQVLLGVVSG